MNNLDVAGILQTYAEKARKCKTKIQLQLVLRNLKREFNYQEVKKVHIAGDDEE